MAPLDVYRDLPEQEVPSDTTEAELAYQRSTSAIEFLSKDEGLRQLKIRNHLLAHELDELHEYITAETERADEAERTAGIWQDAAEDANGKINASASELRSVKRELDSAKAELTYLQSLSESSTNVLTEKLALTRELSFLKPELDHLRTQAVANETLLSDKLSLQQQLSTFQAQLEDERHTLSRLQTHITQDADTVAKRDSEIVDLKKELAKERRERAKAEKGVSRVSQDELTLLKKELAEAQNELQKALKVAKEAVDSVSMVSELREQLVKAETDLAAAQKAATKSTYIASDLAELQQELANEKRERQQAEKAASKANSAWEAEKAFLDDKLEISKSKLRSIKESLKHAQQELQESREQAARPAPKVSKGPSKRTLAQSDPDALLGTPGDARPAVKRNKRASSIVGEKSNFSITPLLARTRGVAPEGQQRTSLASVRDADAEIDADADEPIPSIEVAMASPTPTNSTKKLLAPSSTGNANLKVPSRPGRSKAASKSSLEKVAEEEDPDEDDENTTSMTVAHHVREMSASVKPRLSLKPKPLSSFSSFRDASLQPQGQQKKKRKMLGAPSAKTLFDEDENDEGGLLKAGQRAFGAFGGMGFGRMLGGAKQKGPLVVAADGFMFSPLKKDRKAMAASASAVH